MMNKPKAYGILMGTLGNEPFGQLTHGSIFKEDGTYLSGAISSDEEYLKADLKLLLNTNDYEYEYLGMMPDWLKVIWLEKIRSETIE